MGRILLNISSFFLDDDVVVEKHLIYQKRNIQAACAPIEIDRE